MDMHGHGKKIESHGAVLIVAVGTTQAEGRQVVGNCMKKVQEVYPKAEVTYAFSSEPVRLVLKEQGEDVPGPLAALALLIEKGHSRIVVQPLFLTPGTRYHELYPLVKSLNEMAGAHGVLGFDGILISTPLLMFDEDYFEVAEAVQSIYGNLAEDEAVVLVSPQSEGGTDPALCQLQMVLDDVSKTGRLTVGAVDGYPGIEKVKSRLSHIGTKKVRLVPLTIVPGIHAWIEISGGANSDSWQKLLEAAGYSVEVDSKGLGEYDPITDIIVKRMISRVDSHAFLKK